VCLRRAALSSLPVATYMHLSTVQLCSFDTMLHPAVVAVTSGVQICSCCSYGFRPSNSRPDLPWLSSDREPTVSPLSVDTLIAHFDSHTRDKLWWRSLCQKLHVQYFTCTLGNQCDKELQCILLYLRWPCWHSVIG
jgi:hypothetical protein